MDISIAERHRQIASMSCIPMSVELVLKFLGRVSEDYYQLQVEWQNRRDGSFHQFNNKIIANVLFTAHYQLPRNAEFPIDALFQTIDSELAAGKFVVISLASNGGWHMYVIVGNSIDGDYLAVTKGFPHGTTVIGDVKSRVRSRNGTDILTYTLQDANS